LFAYSLYPSYWASLRDLAMEEASAQPALLETTPSNANLSNAPTIFDMLLDPRQNVESIEAFVLADPSCVRAASPQNGCSPLHEAARRADTRLIQFFLDQGAEVDARGSAGETPLMTACEVWLLIHTGLLAQASLNNIVLMDGQFYL